MRWWWKLKAHVLTHEVLYGAANLMIFAGMILCVVGAFLFAVAPWITWSGVVLFVGGFFVLAGSDKYLPSNRKEKEKE